MHSFKLGSNHIIVIIQTGRKLRKSHAKILEKLCKHLKNKNCCNFMSSQYNFLSSYIKNPSNEMYHFDIQINSKMKLPKHNPLNKTILRSLSCKCYEESNRKECLLQIFIPIKTHWHGTTQPKTNSHAMTPSPCC